MYGRRVLGQDLVDLASHRLNAHYLHLLTATLAFGERAGTLPRLFDGGAKSALVMISPLTTAGWLALTAAGALGGTAAAPRAQTLVADPARTASTVRPARIHFRRLIRSSILPEFARNSPLTERSF